MHFSRQAQVLLQDGSYIGNLSVATHYGVAGSPGGGPYFELWLLVGEDDVIARAKFASVGCPTSRVIGNTLCRIIETRNQSILDNFDTETLTTLVGCVPEGKEHLLTLAAQAIRSIEEIDN